MKLNKDCVRHLLLYLEEQDLGVHVGDFKLKNDFVPKYNYTPEEVEYATRKLKEANFIHADGVYDNGSWLRYSIGEITWDGHQFLDNIRDEKVWKTVKKTASKLSSISLPLMSKLAWVAITKHIDLE